MCFSPLNAVKDQNNNIHLIGKSYDKDFLLSSGYELLKLPCGKCLECRLGYSREWSHRCIVERFSHDHSWFLTLTYDDYNLPVINEVTGEILPHSTLRPSDLKVFLHDLRQFYARKFGLSGIRYFVAGEYGDHTSRPHYHMILFGCPIPDLELYKKSGLGDLYYNSNIINTLWKKGFVVIGDVTAQSASYTARYCLKKTKDLYFSDRYDKLGIIPEFTRCSTRPGIGFEWYDKNKEKLFSQGFVDVSDGSKSVRIFPTKYFKRLYKDAFPDSYADFSEMARYRSEIKLRMELYQTDLNEVEYLASKEEAFKARTKILFERSML